MLFSQINLNKGGDDMAFSNFPYTDFHNLNLDWVLDIDSFGWEKGVDYDYRISWIVY